VSRSVSPAALRAAQLLSVTAGRPTSQARMLPGFLIVGAQRCGTTSMYKTLSQHPAIVTAVLHKGVHYFDANYHHSLGWYRAHFPLRATGRRAARRAGAAALTFESSPYYMFHPLAGERISRDLPAVKLLALVRDPVQRAYSAYAHERARGFETEQFERALELEPERLRGEADRIIADPAYLSHSHQHHAYRTRGQYAEQIARLDQLLGSGRVLVVDSGDFFTKPEPVYDAVLDFLGLPQRGYPQFEQHNARPRSPMPERLRAELDRHFEPHDEQLAVRLGQVPSWRR
jgi:Sulfotransferase domain